MEKENITYKEAFTGPFYADDPGCYIWCKNIFGNEQMCFTVMINWKVPEEFERIKRAAALLNGDEGAMPFKYVGYNFEEDVIGVGDTEEEAGNPILLMRGWGYLTGTGALHLKPEQARKIQLDFMKWAVRKFKGDESLKID